jgi:heptosyltransferase-3
MPLKLAAEPGATSAQAFSPGRILVIVTRQIGDVLLTTPLLEAAHRTWPQATIDVLGFAGTLGMLEGHAVVSARVEIGPRRGWRASLALARGLWRRYDLALVAEASDRAHVLGWIAAPVRAGLVPERRAHAWWKRLLLRHAVLVAGDRGETHVVAEKLALLDPWRAAGPPPQVAAPPPRPLPADLEQAIVGTPVVVHAPSMWRYKQWPVAHFGALVAALLADGRQVVLTGGPAARDREIVAHLMALGPSPQLVDACGRLDFNQLAALFARAALYIGPDTSVTHLAAAAGVPVIALFGPTNPQRWGPLGQVVAIPAPYRRRAAEQRSGRVALLQGEATCAPGVPCGRAGCDDHRDSASACLETGLAPERVIEAARQRLRDADRAVRA